MCTLCQQRVDVHKDKSHVIEEGDWLIRLFNYTSISMMICIRGGGQNRDFLVYIIKD